jgi:hypothetical protein
MSTQQTDPDALREQVRARYAAAATKLTSGDCGCGQPADCGCGEGCCGAATAEEPGFGAELYAALDRDQLPDTAVLASLGCGNPTAVAELHEGETVLDLGSGAVEGPSATPTGSGPPASAPMGHPRAAPLRATRTSAGLTECWSRSGVASSPRLVLRLPG